MAQRPFATTLPKELPCSNCEGSLRPWKMTDYDASDELGLPVMLAGTVLGLRCDRCGTVAVSGSMLDAVTAHIVYMLLEFPRRLSGAEARFLRKALGITLTDLAAALGTPITDIQVWEKARSLSSSEDFQLRGYLVGRLLERRKRRKDSVGPRYDVVGLAQKNLARARQEEAPADPPPLVVGPLAA